MTCIIGAICKKTSKVYIGGDSAGLAGLDVTIRADPKVFRNGPYLIGFTSSYRMGQLLRYALKPPKHKKGLPDMHHLVADFIPAVKQCFADGGYLKTQDGRAEGGFWLLGYRDKLYQIDSDFQVGEPAHGIAAVGCGEAQAYGAMYAELDLAPDGPVDGAILHALDIVTRLNAGVRPPFVIEHL
jgi:hypothetical protein